MSESFEQFVTSLLRRTARGRKVEYNESLKAFVIVYNSWFKRTIYINDLVDAWTVSV
jgi:hypothetical protein